MTRLATYARIFAILCCVVLLVLACTLPLTFAIRDRDLIGWSEDKELNVNPNEGKRRDPASEDGNPSNHGVEALSWSPRIFIYRGLLTEDECDHLIDTAAPRLQRSGVVEEGGGDGISDIRTSDGMFFEREEDAIIATIERKLSEWTLIPLDQGEGLQLLRYDPGQEYKPHFDYFFHEGGIDNGGNRLATVLIYLATPEVGGETVFPNVPVPPSQTRAAGFSECAMEGLAVRPQRGDAVLFWSLRTDGTLDKGSLHGSCPVIKGQKYAVTKWYHVAKYAVGGEEEVAVKHVVFRPPPPPTPPGCIDNHSECEGWADGGECENNPGYMIGTLEKPGECLKSCGRCEFMVNKKKRGGVVKKKAGD